MSIRVDNGPEFASRMLDQWAYLNQVELDVSRRGELDDNTFIEVFNQNQNGAGPACAVNALTPPGSCP
jgi:transposase InsO family protein